MVNGGSEMIRFFIIIFLVISATLSYSAYWAHHWWYQTNITIQSPIEIEIKEGSTIQSVSHELQKRGLIIAEPRLFQWGWRLTMAHSTLKAGDYRFEGNLTPAKIAQILSAGQTITVSFTIPEGFNIFQISERLEIVFPKIPKTKWLDTMRDKKFRDSLPGQPQTVEGFLFPETYTFSRRASPTEVIGAMIQTFKKNFSEDIINKGQRLNLSPLAIVTLASIIEKETGKSDERPHISSVFHNRMRIGMRLQTDPTVIYGIWESYDGNIRRDDLKTPTPYNTYVISGLPPGPISNPGLASLTAAVLPSDTDDLYFVSRGDGSHIFSTNLKDHQKSVIQYQVQPFRNKSVRN